MKCPLCTVDLLVADRQGIEVDYCPTCRGVWLDRGELDKLIERSSPMAGAPSSPGSPAGSPPPRRGAYQDDSDVYPPGRHAQDGYQQYPQKRKSFLRELFDFG